MFTAQLKLDIKTIFYVFSIIAFVSVLYATQIGCESGSSGSSGSGSGGGVSAADPATDGGVTTTPATRSTNGIPDATAVGLDSFLNTVLWSSISGDSNTQGYGNLGLLYTINFFSTTIIPLTDSAGNNCIILLDRFSANGMVISCDTGSGSGFSTTTSYFPTSTVVDADLLDNGNTHEFCVGESDHTITCMTSSGSGSASWAPIPGLATVGSTWSAVCDVAPNSNLLDLEVRGGNNALTVTTQGEGCHGVIGAAEVATAPFDTLPTRGLACSVSNDVCVIVSAESGGNASMAEVIEWPVPAAAPTLNGQTAAVASDPDNVVFRDVGADAHALSCGFTPSAGGQFTSTDCRELVIDNTAAISAHNGITFTTCGGTYAEYRADDRGIAVCNSEFIVFDTATMTPQ